MVDSPATSGRRKVRCPKCTAVFKQPSSPIFWCYVCSNRLSAAERPDCVKCDEGVCGTAPREKWEQFSNVGTVFPHRETSSTQGLTNSSRQGDALFSEAPEGRSPDGSSDSSYGESFSDIDSAPENSGDSDFDFPVPSPEHPQKEETDLYSQMLYGFFGVQESRSKVMDVNKVTENLTTGHFELLSLVKNAVEKAADISKSLHTGSEGKSRQGDGGEQEQGDNACTGNEEGMETLLFHENAKVSSKASICDDEAFVMKTVSESDLETLDAEQRNGCLLSSQNVCDLLSCCDELVQRPESHDTHANHELFKGENGKSNSDVSYLLERTEASYSKVGRRTEGMQTMTQFDDLHNENTTENADSHTRQEMSNAYPPWAMSMEGHWSHFDGSNETVDAFISDESILFNRDNTGYVGFEEKGDACFLKDLLNNRSQDTGIAYPSRTLSIEEHNMFDTSMNARNHQHMKTRLSPSEVREPSAEVLAHHASASMDSTKSAGYYGGRHMRGVHVNNYVRSPEFTRFPNMDQCDSDSRCWQKDLQSRQRCTAVRPESPCRFHHSEDYPVGWYVCSPHENLSNHYNQHHISDAVLMTGPMNGRTYSCQCLRYTTVNHNQALACSRCHPLAHACRLCSPQHSHITQQPLLYHPNEPSYAGYTYPVHPMCDHHAENPIWASAYSNVSARNQARPLVQQIGYQNILNVPLCPQPSVLRKKKNPPFPRGGMVPCILCSHCKLILCVPLGIPIAGRMYQKVRCGHCKGISKYSVFRDQADDQRPMVDSSSPRTEVVPLNVETVSAGELQLSQPKDVVEVCHECSQHPRHRCPTTKAQVLDSFVLSSQSTTCASSPAEDYFSDGVTEKRNLELSYSKLSFTGDAEQQPTNQESGTVKRPISNHNVLETKSKPVAPTSPLIQLFNQESRKFSLASSAHRDPSLSSKTTDDVPTSIDIQGEQRTADANKRSKSVHHLGRQAKYYAGRLKKSLREFARIQHRYTDTDVEVIVNGVAIEDAEVQKAEGKAGVIHPGSYW